MRAYLNTHSRFNFQRRVRAVCKLNLRVVCITMASARKVATRITALKSEMTAKVDLEKFGVAGDTVTTVVFKAGGKMLATPLFTIVSRESNVGVIADIIPVVIFRGRLHWQHDHLSRIDVWIRDFAPELREYVGKILARPDLEGLHVIAAVTAAACNYEYARAQDGRDGIQVNAFHNHRAASFTDDEWRNIVASG